MRAGVRIRSSGPQTRAIRDPARCDRRNSGVNCSRETIYVNAIATLPIVAQRFYSYIKIIKIYNLSHNLNNLSYKNRNIEEKYEKVFKICLK